MIHVVTKAGLAVSALALLGACSSSGGGGAAVGGGVAASYGEYADLAATRSTLTATEGATPRTDLPTTGTATYTGVSVFVVDEDRSSVDGRMFTVINNPDSLTEQDVDALGRARMTADFSGAGSISGSIDGIRTSDGRDVAGSIELAAAPINAGAAGGVAVFQSSVSGSLALEGETQNLTGAQLGRFVGEDGAIVESFMEGGFSDTNEVWGGHLLAGRDD